jgi:hypothetical protein
MKHYSRTLACGSFLALALVTALAGCAGKTGMDATMTGMDHSTTTGMDHSTTTGMDHSTTTGMDHSTTTGMDHSTMPGMDHSTMAGMDHSSVAGMGGAAAAPVDPKAQAPRSSAEIGQIRPAETLRQDEFDAPMPATPQPAKPAPPPMDHSHHGVKKNG